MELVRFNCESIERNADILLNSSKDIGLTVNTGKMRYTEVGRHQGIIGNDRIKRLLELQHKLIKRHLLLLTSDPIVVQLRHCKLVKQE